MKNISKNENLLHRLNYLLEQIQKSYPNNYVKKRKTLTIFINNMHILSKSFSKT